MPNKNSTNQSAYVCSNEISKTCNDYPLSKKAKSNNPSAYVYTEKSKQSSGRKKNKFADLNPKEFTSIPVHKGYEMNVLITDPLNINDPYVINGVKNPKNILGFLSLLKMRKQCFILVENGKG